jgi:CheY-like chemotaxis protein
VYGLGADGYALKPVSKEWLLNSLDRCTHPAESHRILLVDDDGAFRYLVKQLFTGMHHEFIEAENGVTGLEAARTERPTLIFLDLVMPRMNGFEMLEQLRADPATRDVPVIISSSRVLTPKELRLFEGWRASIFSKDRFASGDAVDAVRTILSDIGLSDLLRNVNQATKS